MTSAHPDSSSDGLSAAYEALDQASSLSNPSHFWLWLLLILCVLNGLLWLMYTKSKATWGANSEPVEQVVIAGDRISFLPSTLLAHSQGQNQNQNQVQSQGLGQNKDQVQTPLPLPSPSLANSAPTPNVATIANTPSATESNLAPAPLLPALGRPQGDCMVWAFTNNQEAKRADIRLAEQSWSGYTTELANEPPTYMVYAGPFSQQKQIDALLRSLSALKIKQYIVLPSGSVSLGVVSSIESAKTLHRQLTARGLQGLEIIERPGKVQRQRYRFEAMSAPSVKALSAMAENLGVLSKCS